MAVTWGKSCLSLKAYSTTSVLRYIPADNGRDETLVVVGNRVFVEERVQKCVRSIV